MGAVLIRPAIRRYFEEHPGINVWISDLRELLISLNGQPPTDGGIQSAVNTLMGAGMELFVIERGQCWMYRPNTKLVQPPIPANIKKLDDRRLFQLVHTTKLGAMILEDEDGETIIVRQVDI